MGGLICGKRWRSIELGRGKMVEVWIFIKSIIIWLFRGSFRLRCLKLGINGMCGRGLKGIQKVENNLHQKPIPNQCLIHLATTIASVNMDPETIISTNLLKTTLLKTNFLKTNVSLPQTSLVIHSNRNTLKNNSTPDLLVGGKCELMQCPKWIKLMVRLLKPMKRRRKILKEKTVHLRWMELLERIITKNILK